MESILCRKCGTSIPPIENYCSNCGTRKEPLDKTKQKITKWQKVGILIGIGSILYGLVFSNLVYVLLGFTIAAIGFISAIAKSEKTRLASDIIGGIVAVIVIVVIVGWQIPQFIQEQNESQERLDAAISDLDSIVNTAIVLCEDQANSDCDQLMFDWYNECKKENMELIPSCHDGRIAEYLIKGGLMDGN